MPNTLRPHRVVFVLLLISALFGFTACDKRDDGQAKKPPTVSTTPPPPLHEDVYKEQMRPTLEALKRVQIVIAYNIAPSHPQEIRNGAAEVQRELRAAFQTVTSDDRSSESFDAASKASDKLNDLVGALDAYWAQFSEVSKTEAAMPSDRDLKGKWVDDFRGWDKLADTTKKLKEQNKVLDDLRDTAGLRWKAAADAIVVARRELSPAPAAKK